MAILEVNDVNYSYSKKSKKNILNHVTCQFEEGIFYAIVGKSGNGKSTLLSLLAGLGVPDSGTILYNGTSTDAMDLDEYRRRHTAVIYQDFSLFPQLTVLENIIYPMELCGVAAGEAKKEAMELARKVSLPETLFDSFPGKISGGEQQRVAIARALTMDKQLILADEPTGNLDSENTDIIIDLLKNLAHEEKKCVIVVTHDLDVMQKADIVYQMTDGVLKQRNL